MPTVKSRIQKVVVTPDDLLPQVESIRSKISSLRKEHSITSSVADLMVLRSHLEEEVDHLSYMVNELNSEMKAIREKTMAETSSEMEKSKRLVDSEREAVVAFGEESRRQIEAARAVLLEDQKKVDARKSELSLLERELSERESRISKEESRQIALDGDLRFREEEVDRVGSTLSKHTQQASDTIAQYKRKIQECETREAKVQLIEDELKERIGLLGVREQRLFEQVSKVEEEKQQVANAREVAALGAATLDRAREDVARKFEELNIKVSELRKLEAKIVRAENELTARESRAIEAEGRLRATERRTEQSQEKARSLWAEIQRKEDALNARGK
jgi:chromosome segregation ATPase